MGELVTPAGRVGVLGSINMDLVAQVDRAPQPGETVFGSGFFRAAGGKGANQAVAASRAGASEVTMFGAVGRDDFGSALLAGLDTLNVNVDHVARVDGTPTGTALVIVEASGENEIIVVPGANSDYGPEQIDPLTDYIAQCDVLCCSLEIPMETVIRGAAIAAEAGKTVIVDPAPGQLLPPSLLENVEVLTPNQSEAVRILQQAQGRDDWTADSEPRELLAGLAQLGVPHVLLTLGARGVLCHGEDGLAHLPGHRVKAVDTTAAGDAFVGALAARLAAGDDIMTAVKFANAAGAVSATELGAQPSMPTEQAIRNLLDGAELAAQPRDTQGTKRP